MSDPRVSRGRASNDGQRRYSSREYGTSRGDYSRYVPGNGNEYEYRGRADDYRPRNEFNANRSNNDYGRGPSRGYARPTNNYAASSGPNAFVRRPQRYNPLSPKKTGSNSRAPQTPIELEADGTYRVRGVLEMHPNGFGFLRDPKDSYVRHLYDPFVACGVIERLHLREGVCLETSVRPARGNTGPRVCSVYSVDGMSPEEYVNTLQFDDLTPMIPAQMYRLETENGPLSTRVMDILTPLGKGQRALIVAPPRSGKTVLLQQISQAIIQNYKDVYLTVLLVDERPEEVTDFRASIREYVSKWRSAPGAADAEVVASSLDCELESHIRLAQFVTTRCKRLAEEGKDVFLLLDSITRLARAFNKWGGNSGRTMTGGLDIQAMDIPKKIFASARHFEDRPVLDASGNPVIGADGKPMMKKGGSLTIVGTALVETGSRMDELIFQEFKGTGNMELVLDRRLADRRIWPAIDVNQSGTRREEKLLNPAELRAANLIRRTLSQGDPIDAMERLSATLPRFKSNAEFFNQFIRRLQD